jgi:hypothetical protein
MHPRGKTPLYFSDTGNGAIHPLAIWRRVPDLDAKVKAKHFSLNAQNTLH